MRTKQLIITVICIFFLMLQSCNRKKNEAITMESSENIIKRENLTLIIKDALLLEAALYFKANQGADIKTMTTIYYNELFRKHNTDRNQFFSSIKYFVQNGNEDDNFFTEVINIITVESDSVKKENASIVIEKKENLEQKTDSNHRGGLFRRITKSQAKEIQ